MHELVDVLAHPARWASDAETFPPLTRIYLSLLTLAATVVVAAVAAFVGTRWAARRADREASGLSERGLNQLGRVRRDTVALCVFIGANLAIQIAPLPQRLDELLAGITYVLGALVCARLVIHGAALLLTTSVAHVGGQERSRLEREYVPLAQKVITLAVALIAAVVVAKHFGKDVSSLVAALGVGSLAIGLAAQQTLGNMFAGFVLLVDRPFRPGDRIKLATGEVGEVRDIGVRSTSILMLDGNRLVVPNTELANSRVVNIALVVSHVEVKVLVAYGNDIDRVAQLLTEAAGEVPSLRNLTVRVGHLGERAVELFICFDCATPGEAYIAEERVRRQALKRLGDSKVALPPPWPTG
jgi:small-conductance mechanosensitive channel